MNQIYYHQSNYVSTIDSLVQIYIEIITYRMDLLNKKRIRSWKCAFDEKDKGTNPQIIAYYSFPTFNISFIIFWLDLCRWNTK